MRRRERLIVTSEGTRTGPFGAVEWALFAAVALLWGSAYLWISIALEGGLEPTAIPFVRVALAAVVLLAVPAARRVRPAPGDGARMALLGVLWIALPLTLFPIAQRSVSSAVAGMVTGLQPVLAAIVAAVLLRRAPGARLAAGMLAGAAGVVVIAWAASSGSRSATIGGVALVVAAIACYAVAVNVAVPLQQRHGALPVILRALLVGLVLTLPGGVIGLAESDPSAGSLAAMLPLGALSTGAGYVAFTALAGRAGASRAAVSVYLVPVVALVLGVVVQGDRVGAGELAGVALVLLGSWLAAGARRR